jgi:hypothetical protein
MMGARGVAFHYLLRKIKYAPTHTTGQKQEKTRLGNLQLSLGHT